MQFSSDQIDAILMEVRLRQQCCAWRAVVERAEEALTSDASNSTQPKSSLWGHAALSGGLFMLSRVAIREHALQEHDTPLACSCPGAHGRERLQVPQRSRPGCRSLSSMGASQTSVGSCWQAYSRRMRMGWAMWRLTLRPWDCTSPQQSRQALLVWGLTAPEPSGCN